MPKLSPEEKAMTLAYTHCELLKKNLNVVIHEMGVRGKKSANLKKRLEKLRQSAHEAFLEINTLIKANHQAQEMRDDIENMLDETWSQ